MRKCEYESRPVEKIFRDVEYIVKNFNPREIYFKVEILGSQIYHPYHGGLVYEDAKKYGLKLPDNFEDWATYYDKTH